MSTVNLITVDDLEFAKVFDEPPPPPISFVDDALALSCASYRLGEAGLGKYHELNSLSVLPADRDQAANIRSYYRSKFTWQTLQTGQSLSEFRRKAMLIMEGAPVTNKELGILYRLPYFYVEDTEHEAVFNLLPACAMPFELAIGAADEFEPIRKIKILRKAREFTRYWLKAKRATALCAVVVDEQNTLKPLFNSMFERGPVTLQANWHPKQMWESTNQKYYQLAQLQLA